MKLVIEIEAPIGEGKTRLAQFIENNLRTEYSVELVERKTCRFPLREIYRYNIAQL